MNIHYHHFAHVISHGPATGLLETQQMVLTLSNGECDVDVIAIWWGHWQLLKQAMRENHPVVKLAAALVPPVEDLPVLPVAAYVADQGEDDGFWYVREACEMSRPAQCRAESVVLIATAFPDDGKAAAHIIAQALSAPPATAWNPGTVIHPSVPKDMGLIRDPSAN